MTIAEWGLLIRTVWEGLTHLIAFIQNEQVRSAFRDLQNAKTSEEKSAAARNLSDLLYRS